MLLPRLKHDRLGHPADRVPSSGFSVWVVGIVLPCSLQFLLATVFLSGFGIWALEILFLFRDLVFARPLHPSPAEPVFVARRPSGARSRLEAYLHE